MARSPTTDLERQSVTDVESEKVIRDCLEAGVRGWISKPDGAHDLTTEVESLEQHNSIFTGRVSDLLMSSS